MRNDWKRGKEIKNPDYDRIVSWLLTDQTVELRFLPLLN